MSFKKDLISAANDIQEVGLDADRGYYSCVRENAYKCLAEDVHAFENGDGNEWRCGGKACAVHSSSMLAYNFFSWIGANNTCRIDGVEYNERFFEVRIPCLTTSRANMDVTLLSRDKKHVLFIESKFTEHFSNASSKMRGLSDAYSDSQKYYEQGDIWPKLIAVEKDDAKRGDAYFDGIKQEICHLIAIENIARHNKRALDAFRRLNQNSHAGLVYAIPSIVQFDFMSLVFAPNSKQYKIEHEAYLRYAKVQDAFRAQLARWDSTPNVGVKYMTYSDLWVKIKESIDDQRRQYLFNRYMTFAVNKT